jgi:multidrug efflux pump subunit AcrA (membrane-fusion protein)
MKKKLFLKLFIFAVIGAFVTFTSCKDYDDDISRLDTDLAAAESSLQAAVTELNTLKTQIAAAATDSEVAAAVAAAKTQAIDAAKADATALLNTLKGGYTGTLKELNDKIVAQAALITVLQGDVSTLKTDLDAAELQIAANKAAIELQQSILDKYLLVAGDDNVVDAIAAIKAELATAGVDIDALSTKIDAIDEALNVLDFARINSMITEISFDFVYDDYERYRYLEYSTTTEVVNYVFATGINNPITFKNGQRLASQAQKIIVKVSPANADLSKMLDKISLIRGDNNTEINNYLKVVKAERANPLLVSDDYWYSVAATRATPTASGLWYVSFELSQTADLEDLAELTYGEGVYLNRGVEQDYEGHYLFAMAIENTVEKGDDAEDRFVISDFVISIDTSEEFERASELNFMVDNTNVADINNRAADGSLSLNEDGITYKELVWTDYAQPTLTGNTSQGDDRSSQPVYPAVQGIPMKIKITGDVESIRAMYVTLDYQANAIESAPSEWNAWQSYSYTGLGTVVEGTETQIVINNASAINDMIGFRVFAVNYDGTLVDPDGKAFYASLGVAGANWGTVNTVITPTSETVAGTVSEKVAKALAALPTATSFEWTTDEDENEDAPAFHAELLNTTGGVVFTTNGGTISTANLANVTAIRTVPTAASWLAYKDNKVYNGTLVIKNTTGHVLATLKVTFKKTLPTTAPTGFSVKTNQIGTDGIYRSYLIPMQAGLVNWTAPNATHGSMPLDQVFNFTGDALTSVANFDVIFAKASKSGSNTVDLIVNPGDADLVVAKEFIDNTTQHETSVVYNYGKISTELAAGVDYVIEIENFPTIFSNIYNNTYSWSWVTTYNTTIEYGTDVTIPLSNILGKSSRDNIYNAPLSAPYLNSLSLNGLGSATGGAKLYSNGTTIEEYFNATLNIATGTITLTEASASSNPTANVASTLVITVFDMYGHEVVISLPMTVKTRN